MLQNGGIVAGNDFDVFIPFKRFDLFVCFEVCLHVRVQAADDMLELCVAGPVFVEVDAVAGQQVFPVFGVDRMP